MTTYANSALNEIFEPGCFFKRDVRDKKTLPAGMYGMSCHGLFGSQNRKIYMKQLYSIDADGVRFDYIKVELFLLMFSTEKFLLPPIGFVMNRPITIATDYISNGSLSKALHSKNKLNATQKTNISLGIAHGMRSLHKRHIIHGNLKASNIFLDKDCYPLISDFGYISIAQRFQSELKHRSSSPYWWAPELFLQKNAPVTEASDVYAFGILLYELLTETIPFENLTEAEIKDALNDPYDQMPLPSDAPKVLIAAIQCCVAKNPSKRPSFKSLYKLFKYGHAEFEGTERSDVLRLLKSIEEHKKPQPKSLSFSNKPIPNRSQFVAYFKEQSLINSNETSEKRFKFLHLPHHKEVVKRPKDLKLEPGKILPINKTTNHRTEVKFVGLNTPLPKSSTGVKMYNSSNDLKNVRGEDIGELRLNKAVAAVAAPTTNSRLGKLVTCPIARRSSFDRVPICLTSGV